MKATRVFFFQNGNTSVFDENGKQMTELQQPWFLKFLEFLKSQTSQEFDSYLEIKLPDGHIAEPFRTTDGGWNWRLK